MTNTADCDIPSSFKSSRQVDPAKPGQLAPGDTTIKKIPVGVTTRNSPSLTYKYPLGIENTLNLHSGENAEVLTSAKSVAAIAHVSQSVHNKKLVMSHGNIVLAAKKNEALHGDRQSKNSIVDSKLKHTTAVANQPELVGNACSLNILNDANISCETMAQQDSKKLHWVASTGTYIETYLNNKAPSTGELATTNFQRVSVDCELEQDKRMCADEKWATAAKKARGDTILERAKVVKNSQDQIAKWASRKAMPELSKRKCHWEFVLEEVAWMANDFMKERLWKMSAAAQLCQWAAHCVYHSQFKSLRSEQEPKRGTFNTRKRVVKHSHSTGTSLSKESFEELNQIECLDNCDIKMAVPVDVDNSTYQEGKLFYVVPEGVLESYRNSVERDWAAVEAEHLAEAEAQACLVTDLDMPAFGHETKPLIGQSLARIGYGYDGDKPEIQDITSSLDSSGGPRSVVAKRKRKQILKATNRSSEVVPNVVSYLPDPDTFDSVASDYAPARRPVNSYVVNQANVGSIPTKRLRTAAVAARQRAPGTAGSTLNKLDVTGLENNITGAMEVQQKGLHCLLEVSVPLRNPKAESSPKNSTQGATSDDICSSHAPKKKKNAKFHSVALSSTADGALHASYSGKLSNSAYVQQYEVNRNVEQKAQIKRKSDQLQQTTSNVSSSDLGFGPTTETPEILSSQGVAEQHLLKKVKLLKQLPEEHHDSICTPNQVQATQASPLVANLTSSHKVLRQNSSRDRAKKNKLGKGYILQPPISQPGLGIPWSTIEDQAILALVHDLGPNWELVSDVLSSSSQVKGIFRKPVDCEARHKALLECLLTDEIDSSEDINSHAQSSSFLRNSKGSIRVLLQRLQGPMEEDTLKVHFACIVHIVQQDHHRRNQIKNDSQKLQEILPAHISHVSAMSQLGPSSLTDGALTPLDLCDRPSLNAEVPTNAFMAYPPHMSGMGFTGVVSSGSRLRPSSASLPLLSSLHGGPTLSPSTATMNAARDAQWMAASMRALSAEEQRLRYTRLVTGRGLPQDPSCGNVPLMNLSHSSDCSIPILPMTNNGSLIGGLSRSLSFPRPGIQTMLVSGVSGIVPGGINGMLPSAGIAVASTSTLATGSVAGQLNLMRRPRDALQTIRAGQGTEDQRLMLIQELQHHASQGNTHAAAALSSLPNTMVSSPSHAFVLQQQQSLHQLQPQQPNQAYLQLAKERRLQQEQEQQQQYHKRLLQQHHQQQQQLQHNSSVQPQSHSLAQHQPITTHQQKLHSQHVNPTMPALTPEEQSAVPLSPPTLQTSRPQQSLTTTQHQSLGPSVEDSSHQVLNQKQLQSHQQLQSQLPSRGVKGP
ncbi:hypothetical protein O6H91_11G049100 [Diphasiastrum complanatum]|nr:hypothetical protein O6H91_11G049100 [Diphasiastrum complanatum]